jgi:hypothetical protein
MAGQAYGGCSMKNRGSRTSPIRFRFGTRLPSRGYLNPTHLSPQHHWKDAQSKHGSVKKARDHSIDLRTNPHPLHNDHEIYLNEPSAGF